MPQKKYIVRLSPEREICQQTVRKLNGSSEKVRRAQILLKADADGPGWTDQQIAYAISCRTKTVDIRERCVLEGFERALERKRRALPQGLKLLDGEQEAQVIALRLGSPPKGYANWSLRLLARLSASWGSDRSATKRSADAKKNEMTRRKIHPAGGRVRGAHGVHLYRDPTTRIVRSCAWMSSRCWSRKGRRARAASTTSTNGPARPRSSCRAAGGLAAGDGAGPAYEGGLGGGGRRAAGRTLRRLPEGHLGVRQPQHAHEGRLLRGVRAGAGTRTFVDSSSATPKHGSWLNIAELSAMTRQCLSGLASATRARCRRGPATPMRCRQMKVDDARCKLKSVYPKILM